ncbi:MAG TPA: hypothetical protein VK995_04210, partial [Oceanipulchritudo sp.]|nr:hypothetical protein [Oceanipulchritudo sp.]
MITSLSGEFIEFKASYTHAAELGGEETSLIEALNAHFIAHEVLNDEPGRDKILDFLADVDRDAEMLPEALYETNGNILPVNHVTSASILSPLQGREFVVQVNPDAEGWGYVRLRDPGQAKYKVQKVIRSDGKVISLHNVWTNIRYDRFTNEKLTYLNIFDRYEIGQYTYAFTYAPPPTDVEPPETRIRFSGEVTRQGDNYYITRDTQMYFTSEDVSPVSIFYKVNNGPFVPAIPFKFDDPGNYDVIYYAEDLAGNEETESFARLIIAGAGPQFETVATAEEVLFLKGDVLSARTDEARIDFTVSPNPTQVDAQIEIFEGVRAFPRVAGMPPSPSPLDSLDLQVSGDYVDFYKYRLNEGPWSAEQTVSTPLSLSGLSGPVKLEVLARSAHGAYPLAEQALAFSWIVDAAAVEVTLTGIGAQPVTVSDLELAASGNGFTEYRWTIDNDYYRAPLPAGDVFLLEALKPGSHELDFNTDADGDMLPESEHAFSFAVDPAYGSALDDFEIVYAETRLDVAGAAHSFVWDGRDASGILLTPGWYTVRIQLSDPLGQTGFATRLVQVEDLSGDTAVLSAKAKGPQKLATRGGYAVWQERIGNDWDIVLYDLKNPESGQVALTDDTIIQQQPQTDGEWVVWQVYRDNNYDIEAYNPSQPAAGVLSVTSTIEFNETAPAVDWPWVVYQRRLAGKPDA